MIILSSCDKSADFAEANFNDFEKNPAISSFIQLMLHSSERIERASNLDFATKLKLQVPIDNHIAAYVFDAKGTEIVRIDIAINDEGSEEIVDQFVREHQPAKLDAKTKWNQAFAEAKRSNRKVWARISQRYCGPCFLLARWLDDQENLLAKDFVMLKIDDARDDNGIEVADRITRSRSFGIPFHAIFDSDEQLLIDSESPVGNVGFPSGFEGKKYLRKMLLQTRIRLTDEEIDYIVETLED